MPCLQCGGAIPEGREKYCRDSCGAAYRRETYRKRKRLGETSETFTLYDYPRDRKVIFDVGRARQVTALREASVMLDLEALAPRFGRIRINERHAARRGIDLTDPAIAVPYEGTLSVIDGWHRCYRAYKNGRKTYPAHVLSPSETRAIVLVEIAISQE